MLKETVHMIQVFLHQKSLILLALQPSVAIIQITKIVLKLLSVSVRRVLFLTIVLIAAGNIYSRDNKAIRHIQDSVIYDNSLKISKNSRDSIPADTLFASIFSDSLNINDTIAIDTVSTDSVVVSKPRSGPLKDKVTYSSKDSMRVDVINQKLYLYGDAQVNYQDIELKAYYIILDLGKEEVFARGWPDSLGNAMGKPDFKKGSQNFQSDSMRYNFKTESGIIYHIITQEGEGYLHSEKTKRHPDEHIHLENGKYTTCDLEHPHFYMALTKGIVIPEDKIVTGPAYMVIADVPIRFFGIPFGFFPNTNERASGILIPSYGEERTRGFYLQDFGWYQVLGDFADLRIQGDAYTKGSWAIRNMLSYKYRYHFSGSFAFNYGYTDDRDYTDYVPKKDYAVRWTHRQDPKANPTQTFSASVNFTSREYDQNYSYSGTQRLSATTSSNINYSKQWPGTPFNLTLSSRAEQNRLTGTVDVELPVGSFNMSSIYPFRSKTGTGKYKWYENIGLSYSSKFENSLSTYNDVLFERETWDSLKNGFMHTIPLSVPFKLGKLVTITPSINYTGVVYTHHKEINNYVQYDSISREYDEVVREYKGLKYEQGVNPSIGISFTPKLYGMFVSTKEGSYVEAVRHVLSPSASFSYTPDMNWLNDVNYYDTLYKFDNGKWVDYRVYNWYEDEPFSPPASNKESGSLRLNLNNNLEMKVRPKNDTTGEPKKIVLLENLNFATTYSPFKDSLRWSDVTMTTGTKLFNNKLDVRIQGRYSPYAEDSVNNTIKMINEYYIQRHKGKILRFVSFSANIGFSLKSAQGKNDETDETGNEVQDENAFYDDYYLEDDLNYFPGRQTDVYVDYDIPWSLNVRHSFSITSRLNAKPDISHTVNLSGDISLTPKWKLSASTNYDIELKKLSYTTLTLYRDLHCWEMSFHVVPFGKWTSYTFTIRAKASMLHDLKYEKKPNWFDKF